MQCKKLSAKPSNITSKMPSIMLPKNLCRGHQRTLLRFVTYLVRNLTEYPKELMLKSIKEVL